MNTNLQKTAIVSNLIYQLSSYTLLTNILKIFVMTLTQDLLTENRYWTFWSGDWSIRVNVLWNGKTKWKKVQDKVIAKMIKDYPDKLPTILEAGYERQVCLQNPDITFA